MANLVERCLVLRVEHNSGVSKAGKSYDFAKLWYVRLDALTPSVSPDGKSRGIKLKEESLDSSIIPFVPEAPAIYDIGFDYMTVRGEEKLLPVSFNHVNSLSECLTVKKEKA